MQTIIDSCKMEGIQPIIARLLATNPAAAGWQVNIAFETAIDNLVTQNKLIPGPDLYTYFLANTSQHISDGIHPDAAGAAAIQKLWADKMASQYTPQAIAEGQSMKTSDRLSRDISISTTKSNFEVQTGCAGTLRLFSTNGALQRTMKIPAAGSFSLPATKGLCIARFSSNHSNEEILPVVFR
jgi:hypothetical protein